MVKKVFPKKKKFLKKGFNGRGDYHVKGSTPGANLGYVAGLAGGLTANAYGFPVNPVYTAKVGAAAGHLIGTLVGSGDYHSNDKYVGTNSIINPAKHIPMIYSGGSADGRGSIIVRKREYLGDVVSSAIANTFQAQVTDIQPGNPNTFPWLAAIAQHFEQYRIRGMVFEFVSLSGDSVASVQSGLGFVAMATQYDVLDNNFINKSQIENYDMSQSAKPSRNQVHGVECAGRQSSLKQLYTYPGTSLPVGADPRLYNFGKFTIATACPGVSVTLGELWVSYDIELLKPKLPEIIPSISFTELSSKIERNSPASNQFSMGLIPVSVSGNLTVSCTNVQITCTGVTVGQKFLVSINICTAGLISTLTAPPSNPTLVSGCVYGLSGSLEYPSTSGNNVNNGVVMVSGDQYYFYETLITATSDTFIINGPTGTFPAPHDLHASIVVTSVSDSLTN